MIKFTSNYIQAYDNDHRDIANITQGKDCCQDVRLTNRRGWYIYIPTKWLELLDISNEDMLMYLNYLSQNYINLLNCEIKYLGIEEMPLVSYINSSINLSAPCHILYLSCSSSNIKYSWEIYVAFILIRNLYIYYGWPYAKAMISLLKEPTELNPEEIIAISYAIGNLPNFCKNKKQSIYFEFNGGNQLFAYSNYKLNHDWIKKWNRYCTSSSYSVASANISNKTFTSNLLYTLYVDKNYDEIIKTIYI